ncbi:hypothetical protein ABZP36_016930 [Zizania latifolia]
MPGPKNVLLWQRLRRWLEEVCGRFLAEDSREFSLENLGDEIAMLDNALSGVDQRVGFCHNDLHYRNIMIYEEIGQVTLIDYEHASFNPVAFDIADHFCEMSADYHSTTPHVLDFTKYPGIDEQHRFVQMYLVSSGKWKHTDLFRCTSSLQVSGSTLGVHTHASFRNIIKILECTLTPL